MLIAALMLSLPGANAGALRSVDGDGVVWVVLCGGSERVAIPIGPDGAPAGPVETSPCPDFLLTAAGPPAPAALPRPEWRSAPDRLRPVPAPVPAGPGYRRAWPRGPPAAQV